MIVEWMAGWLKTVVTVILLATFVDLLLPSSAMQRYVRTVLSLFILLALLSPLVGLLQKGLGQPERLFSLIEGEQARMAAAEGFGGEMPSLDAIRRKAAELQAENAKQEKRLVETQLAQQIRDRLQGETALPVSEVRVTTAEDKQNKPYIQDVQVVLGAPEAKRTGQGAASNQVEIKPVEPVQIRIGGADSYRSAAASAGSQPPEFKQDKAAAQSLISREWQLPEDRIRVTYAPDATPS
jgi:stage III sporulation protein AF